MQKPSKKLTLQEVNHMIDMERGAPKVGIVKFTPIDPNSRLAKLYRMQVSLIREQREAYEDEHYRVEIHCPVHEGHEAWLYQHGHRYAGIWECQKTGESDSCEHDESHREVIEVDVFEPVFGHDTREETVSVCDRCECTVED
jgi:hypothetical protein